jgi:leader peptidase (prepilin peptidase)/N-methyltransferase
VSVTEALGWPIGLALAGLVFGSFIGALVVRWPQGCSVMRGRSRCDGCGRVLRARDLVPVLSFVRLRGRCRDCGAAIDRRQLATEGLAAAIGLAAGLVAPGLAGVAGAVFGWLLLALGALDLAALWLPDRLVGLLAAAGIASGVGGCEPPLGERLIGGGAGFASLWLVGRTYRRLRGREGLGGGDPKLFGAIGLWLGWRLLPAVLLLASLVGLGAVGWRLATRRPVTGADAMPLGTLLGLAAYPAWLVMVAWLP